MTFALRILWSSSTNPLHEMWTRKIEERGSRIRGRHEYMVPRAEGGHCSRVIQYSGYSVDFSLSFPPSIPLSRARLQPR